MNPNSRGIYSWSERQRDAKIARAKSRLSLAHAARNRHEVTRLTREVSRLSQSL